MNLKDGGREEGKEGGKEGGREREGRDLLKRPPPTSTLFPNTTLFRSEREGGRKEEGKKEGWQGRLTFM